LVRIEADAGPERGLEKVRIGRGDAVPSQRVQVRGEPLWRIESAAGNGIPSLAGDDLPIQLPFPKHVQWLPLGVIVHTRQPDQRGVPRIHRRNCLFNEIKALPNPDDLADVWDTAVATHGERRTV